MSMTSATIRIDSDLKSDLKNLMDELGLDMSTYFVMSAKQAVREQGIPFNVTMDIPNTDTARAMRDVKNGIGLSKKFKSVSELMDDLNADD